MKDSGREAVGGVISFSTGYVSIGIFFTLRHAQEPKELY
jgi:hypothetical protein